MAISNVAQFTLSDLATLGAGANQIGSITDAEGDTVTVRDRWNSVATVLVTDHPASGTDGVIFENKQFGGPWVLGGAKLGTYKVTGSGQDPVTGQDIVIPV
jgi:glycine cleavage system pyridoxal-binding protein P